MPSISFEHGGVTYEVRAATGLDRFDAPYVHSVIMAHIGDGSDDISNVVWGRIIMFTNIILLTSVTDGNTPAWLVERESSATKITRAYDAFIGWLASDSANGFIDAWREAESKTRPNA